MRSLPLAVVVPLIAVVLASFAAYGLLTYYMRWSEMSMMCADALERRRSNETNFLTALIASYDSRIQSKDFMGTAIRYRDYARDDLEDFCPGFARDSIRRHGISTIGR